MKSGVAPKEIDREVNESKKKIFQKNSKNALFFYFF